MRSATLDNLVQDYVRTAYAKGAGTSRVLYLHVLRNSMIPMVTILGLSLPILLAGSLVTEQVFNYPGMGLLFYQEAVTSDYPVLLGITLVVGVATVLGQPARRHRLRRPGPAGEVRMITRTPLLAALAPPRGPETHDRHRPSRRASPSSRREPMSAAAPRGWRGARRTAQHAATRAGGLRAEPAGPGWAWGSIVLMVLFCFVGPLDLPHRPGHHEPRHLQRATQRPPHPLGTDPVGYDAARAADVRRPGLARGRDRGRRAGHRRSARSTARCPATSAGSSTPR